MYNSKIICSRIRLLEDGLVLLYDAGAYNFASNARYIEDMTIQSTKKYLLR